MRDRSMDARFTGRTHATSRRTETHGQTRSSYLGPSIVSV
jgi:hypothetical protein